MSTKWLLAGSLALNALLGAALLLSTSSAGRTAPRSGSLAVNGDGLNLDSAIPWRLQSLDVRLENMDWNAVWQHGYAAAAAHFRERGFPDSAVEDLVIGRINRRYGPELLRLRSEVGKFWQPEQRRDRQEAEASRAMESQAGALEAERDQAAFDALGLDWSGFVQMLTGLPSANAEYLSVLSSASQARASSVLRQFGARERAVIRGANGTVGIPERAELDALYRAKIADLRQFLSEDELEEYELRAGPTANRMRQLDLIGFDPTEQEFRSIHRIRKAFDEQCGPDGRASDGPGGLRPAQMAMEQQLEEALGPERYRDYRRSMDYTFRGLVELTAEFEVAVGAAADVHQLRETTLQRIHGANTNPALSPEQRAALLEKIRAEAQIQARAWLGEPAYGRYRQMQISGWLNDPEGA